MVCLNLTEEETRLKAQRGELKKLDLSQAEIKRAMDLKTA